MWFEILLLKIQYTFFFSDCESFFGPESVKPMSSDDSVTCETQYSQIVPLEGGEVILCTIFVLILDAYYVLTMVIPSLALISQITIS